MLFRSLEHSVLCGSARYPVKEPFVELLKSSMNTFLNAMTFQDKTVYPVSSRNAQDYLNLTSVYLDAVFAPRILEDPNIFRQEGWHYEPEGDKLTFNGVVFNEMKGAMSSVDSVVAEAMQHLIFQDNCYGYNSGGDPKVIPQLTYGQFLDAYRKNYHPTNARIFLDGDIPLEETLALIESYLCSYDMGSRQELTPQLPKAGEKTVYYEAAPEEDLSAKAQLMLGKLMCTWADKTQILAAIVLSDVLAGSNEAPLKRAILNAGLGQDVSMEINDGVFQPWITLRIHNMKAADAPAIRQLLTDTAAKLVREGLPKEDLLASINHMAFMTKDMHEPQGLIRCLNAMDSWLYGGDPMLYLHHDEAIAALREMAAADGFEQLLQQLLLDEEGLCILHALPSATLGEETREEEAALLEQLRGNMTEAELAQIQSDAESLHAWQQTPDDPQALAALPTLDLDQISPEPNALPTHEDTAAGVTILRHTANTNGILHINAYFSLADLTLEELTAASFMTLLLGQLPTARYDATQLLNQVKSNLGYLVFRPDVFARNGQQALCTPMLTAMCGVLKENLSKAEELIIQVLTETDFNQPERIREILLQTETEAQQSAMAAGHRFAINCATAHYSASQAVYEAFNAVTYLNWLHAFARDFDNRIDGFIALCRRILQKAVCTSRMTLGITEDCSADLSGLLSKLPQGEAAPAAAHYETTLPQKLGIRIPAQVSFAVTASHLLSQGIAYNGTLKLLTNILSLSCLWNSIRVQGGAYGAGIQSSRSGSLFCYSYRDPSPARSLGVYRTLSEFIRQFRDSGEALDKFIISTIAGMEPLVSPRSQANTAQQLWFAGIRYEDDVLERRQLLNATWEDLLNWCAMLDALADGSICVVGHNDALKDCHAENLTVIDV